MQSTVTEHAASKHADRSCDDCHMPASPGGTRRSHAFRVQGDSSMLRSALSASAERATPRAVTVSLSVSGAGHAVPTGDMKARAAPKAAATASSRGTLATPCKLA